MKQGYTELTLELLERSPEVGRLLVQLHDKHKIYALSDAPEPEVRAELTNIMTDLLEVNLSPAQSELVTDVLMSLVRQAERDLKQALAERLASMDNVPLRLIVHLANEEISVADAVLRRSRVLDDMDLVYITKTQTKEHWQAIASRPKLSAGLIDVLADTKDVGTAIGLTKNKSIRLTDHAMSVFSGMAQSSDELAKPLLMREELPSKMATQLYSHVGRELKDLIKKNYSVPDNSSNLFDQAVDDIVFELSSADRGEFYPTMKMIVAAENMLEKGFLGTDVMIDNLRRGQIGNYIAMFSVYCGLPVDTVVEILHQKTAQGLAVACKATGIQKPEFVNMFLLTSRLRGGKVIDQRILGRALAYYDKIKESMARSILNASRH